MYSRSFKELFGTVGPDRPKTAPQSRAQRLAKVAPAVMAELLEGRRMLDGSAIINSRVLEVTGTTGDDTIVLFTDPFGTDIFVEINFGDPPFGPFDPDDFDSASVSALAGHDSVEINAGGMASDFLYPTSIDGAAGNDTINAGDMTDLVYGGDGNDVIDARDGTDVVYGGVGYDTVYGGEEADVVFGGTGSGADSDSVTGYDLIYGDDGNDTLHGEGGGDTVYGGSGADSIRGGDFFDLIYGGEGADTMYGDDGDDYIYATEQGTSADVLYGGSGNDCGWWRTSEDSAIDMEGNLF